MAFFSKENTVEAPKAPKASKKNIPEIHVENLETFAAICKVAKAIETVQQTFDGILKKDIKDTFVGMGMQLGRRPENYKGTDSRATASIQLKTLSSRSTITQENVDRLAKEGVPVKVVDEVVETFILNPEYANNSEVIAKMEAALAGVAGLPGDLFLHQSQKKYVVDGDNTMNALFAIKNKAVVEELLPLVATFAIKPTTEMTMLEAMETVQSFLEDVSEAAEQE